MIPTHETFLCHEGSEQGFLVVEERKWTSQHPPVVVLVITFHFISRNV